MNNPEHKLTRFVFLGAFLLILLIFAASQAGWGIPGHAQGSSPNIPAAITPGQQAAIDGASQLLLLQPETVMNLYLPLVDR